MGDPSGRHAGPWLSLEAGRRRRVAEQRLGMNLLVIVLWACVLWVLVVFAVLWLVT